MSTTAGRAPDATTEFPIRCQWSGGPDQACGRPASCAVTTGCPHGTDPVPPFETLTCLHHEQMFDARAAETGFHFIKVCCDRSHGAVVLSRRPLNEGDLP